MVDREVDEPAWVVLGRFGGLSVRSWAALGASVAGLGLLLVPMSAVLGRSWDLCWQSWAALGPQQAVLGRSRGLSRRSWVALGA